MVFVAQLWKYTSGKLENKNGHWMYMEETWILSNESSTSEGLIIKDSFESVLKVLSNDRGMHLMILHIGHFLTFKHPILMPAIASYLSS